MTEEEEQFEKLVKNFSENDFKCLTEECGSRNLELLQEKKCLAIWVQRQF